jgi:SAM-dependent methyltransferase
MNLLKASTREMLDDFARRCKALHIEELELVETAQRTIKHLRSSKTDRAQSAPTEALMTKWYEKNDLAIYRERAYLAELLACFVCYSRVHIKQIRNVVEKPLTVLDLGGGIGYSTATLAQLYPQARCFYYDLQDTFQAKFAEELANDYNFYPVYSLLDLPTTVDVGFASEYFEHFDDPVQHLNAILNFCKPRHFFIANSFNAKAVGHFDLYWHGYEPIMPTNIGRVFNKVMRKQYLTVATRFWNNRPQYWQLLTKADVQDDLFERTNESTVPAVHRF